MQTPYGPMYALMTSWEKQAKTEQLEMPPFYPQNNKLVGLEGAHYNHVHGWVKSTGMSKTLGRNLSKQLSFEAFALLGVTPNLHVFLTH